MNSFLSLCHFDEFVAAAVSKLCPRVRVFLRIRSRIAKQIPAARNTIESISRTFSVKASTGACILSRLCKRTAIENTTIDRLIIPKEKIAMRAPPLRTKQCLSRRVPCPASCCFALNSSSIIATAHTAIPTAGTSTKKNMSSNTASDIKKARCFHCWKPGLWA